MSLLKAKHLTKVFRRGANSFNAVDDASLALEKGELVAMVGRSGSGKTTLLNLLTGLIAPDSGEVELEKVSLYSLPEGAVSLLRNQKIGYLPQGRSLLGSLSAIDNVRLPFYLARREGDSRDKAMELLRALSVDHLADSPPQSLSGGELRRVALARSLINSPVLLIADEPTSDLDEKSASDLMDVIRRLADGGTCVLIATHDRLATAKADRALSMAGGVLSEDAA